MTTFYSSDNLSAFTSTHLDPTFYSSHAPSYASSSSSMYPPPSPSLCGSASSRSSGGRNRVNTACSYCRTRKIKCDGGVTCANCHRTKRACVYTEVSDDANRAAKERKAYLKSLKTASPSHLSDRSARGMTGSSSCPQLLQGWSPKKSPSMSSFPPSSPSSRPFPSVLLPSPFIAVSPSPSTCSTYTSSYPPPSPSPSTSSSRCFTTPPTSPSYRSSHPAWIVPSTTTTPQFEPINYGFPVPQQQAPTYHFDLSASPVGLSEFAPLPEDTTPRPSMAGLGFSFSGGAMEGMNNAMTTVTEGEATDQAVWLDNLDFGGEAQWVIADVQEEHPGAQEQQCEWVAVPQQEMESFWVPTVY